MKPLLTIFTPTYNRAYTLHMCYESLLRQTVKEFTWLIIDDGSSDNSRELVNSWIEENKINIKYYYQDNKGMHGAHNTAYELIDTELNVCIDSDDYLADNAVEKITTFWKKYGNTSYAGIIALDADRRGEIIGTKLPENLKSATLYNLYSTYKVSGDKKLVYRSDITRQTPSYPLFPNEKYCPLSYKYLLIDRLFPLLIMNDVLCHVEYLIDGSSMNMVKQYKSNPQGFAFFRRVAMENAPTLKDTFRECIHYVSSSLMIRDWRFINKSPKKLITFLSIPVGIILYAYLGITQRASFYNNRNSNSL